ncbi:MAG: hypothetical protein VYA30_00725 [Myxococcota bacterium]|nr:hypothetical protein [Myxococcota bacterium]
MFRTLMFVSTLMTAMTFGCGGTDDPTSQSSMMVGFGQSCSVNADCQTNLCHPQSFRCTATCTDSFQCGAGATCEGGICQFGTGPVATGGTGGGNGGSGGSGGAGGGNATQVDIYDVKSGTLADDTTVSVEGVVTAVRLNADNLYSHMVLQVPVDSARYRGQANSGIWIYLNNADNEAWRMNPPMPGTLVRLTGRTNDFYGQWQIQHVEALQSIGQSVIPDPVVVPPGDISTGGPQASALEGMLVRVDDVAVIDVEPEVGPGDGQDGMPTYEFVVDGQLRIDDYFYRLTPLPTVGTRFQSIAGVLRLGNANSKIEPRGPSDIRQ